jgi:hypothetical protein
MGVDPGPVGLTVGLAARQDQIATVVAALAETVERLSTRASTGVGSSRRVQDLDGAELVEWVRWLVGHYEMTAVLPDCWPRHGALVEELAALYVAWQTLRDQAARRWRSGTTTSTGPWPA